MSAQHPNPDMDPLRLWMIAVGFLLFFCAVVGVANSMHG